MDIFAALYNTSALYGGTGSTQGGDYYEDSYYDPYYDDGPSLGTVIAFTFIILLLALSFAGSLGRRRYYSEAYCPSTSSARGPGPRGSPEDRAVPRPAPRAAVAAFTRRRGFGGGGFSGGGFRGGGFGGGGFSGGGGGGRRYDPLDAKAPRPLHARRNPGALFLPIHFVRRLSRPGIEKKTQHPAKAAMVIKGTGR
ncbi:MAG: hypothetical protein ACLTSG_08575 [Lachnospiraceae bacterium]